MTSILAKIFSAISAGLEFPWKAKITSAARKKEHAAKKRAVPFMVLFAYLSDMVRKYQTVSSPQSSAAHALSSAATFLHRIMMPADITARVRSISTAYHGAVNRS